MTPLPESIENIEKRVSEIEGLKQSAGYAQGWPCLTAKEFDGLLSDIRLLLERVKELEKAEAKLQRSEAHLELLKVQFDKEIAERQSVLAQNAELKKKVERVLDVLGDYVASHPTEILRMQAGNQFVDMEKAEMARTNAIQELSHATG